MSTSWPGLSDALAQARRDTGLADSVTWETVVDPGVTTVVITGHFAFLGGSMGVDHGDTVIAALRHALAHECAVVFVTSSGGARTQEGFAALFQMPRILEAVRQVREGGLPIVSVFRHPTTGGVHASYGAAADIIVAEEGATVGFAGPRVLTALTGTAVEAGESHSAGAYRSHGLVDEVVPAGEGRAAALAWVRRLASAPAAEAQATSPRGTLSTTGWAAVERAREPGRPSARRIAAFLLTDFHEVHGDRTGTDDPVVVAGFGRFGGAPAALIGTDRHQRREGSPAGAPHAAGFRKAARVVALASRLGIPVLSVIDTRGADATAESDNSGLTAAISGLMLELLRCTSPTLSAVTGEGGSGGAIAFASTDVLVMQDDSVFEVIAPEGAAAILYRDPHRAGLAADQMALDAASLHARGFVDAIVPGPTSAGVFPSLAYLRSELRAQLQRLSAVSPQTLRERRSARYA